MSSRDFTVGSIMIRNECFESGRRNDCTCTVEEAGVGGRLACSKIGVWYGIELSSYGCIIQNILSCYEGLSFTSTRSFYYSINFNTFIFPLIARDCPTKYFAGLTQTTKLLNVQQFSKHSPHTTKRPFTMLDIFDFIVEKGGDPKKIKESQRRRYAPEEAVDEVIALYEDHRKSQS